MNHFSGSLVCKEKQAVHRIQDGELYLQTVMNVVEWPGVASGSNKTRPVNLVSNVNTVATNKQHASKHVQINIGATPFTLYADTGSAFTIIPPQS